MTDHKFTDEEVIRGLECCAEAEYCATCPSTDFCKGMDSLMENALSLIKRQNAEIERLRENNNLLIVAGQEWQKRYETANSKLNSVLVEKYPYIDDVIADAKSEAIKEFAENLTQDIKSHRLEMNMNGLKGTHRTDEITYETIIEYIDNLVKEMTEVQE